MGSSRGSMATGWAMTANFDKDCDYDLAEIGCAPPRRDPAIKGALLVAEFSSGVGYLPAQTTPKDDGREPGRDRGLFIRSEEHTSELQSLMRISYAVFCLKKKKYKHSKNNTTQ